MYSDHRAIARAAFRAQVCALFAMYRDRVRLNPGNGEPRQERYKRVKRTRWRCPCVFGVARRRAYPTSFSRFLYAWSSSPRNPRTPFSLAFLLVFLSQKNVLFLVRASVRDGRCVGAVAENFNAFQMLRALFSSSRALARCLQALSFSFSLFRPKF